MSISCFVIMPFANEFDKVFQVIKIVSAKTLHDSTIKFHWLKEEHAAGKITDDISEGIGNATFCISDISGSNPNVMWETGYAMALGKPTILISHSPIENIPFDLKISRVLIYSLDDLGGFEEKLGKSIANTMSKYPIRTITDNAEVQFENKHVISVTGSQNIVDVMKLQKRIKDVLSPYLANDITWLVGTMGCSDVNVINFLLSNNQKVIGVGYNRWDYNEEILGLIKANKIGFMAADLEKIPKAYQHFGKRNTLFLLKSDLAILFWNGESKGLIDAFEYLKEQELPTLFVTV